MLILTKAAASLPAMREKSTQEQLQRVRGARVLFGFRLLLILQLFLQSGGERKRKKERGRDTHGLREAEKESWTGILRLPVCVLFDVVAVHKVK